MSFSYKIVAFDLDGTLAESKQPLGLEVAELLFKLAKTLPVVIISGGSELQFEKQFISQWKKLVPQVPEVNKNLILLSTSGTQDYEYDKENDSWKEVYKAEFPEDKKQAVKKFLEEMITSGKYDIPSEHEGEYVEDRGTQITFSACGQNASIEKKKGWDPSREKRRKMKAVLESHFPDLGISIGGMTSIDILTKGFTKAVGLKMLLQRKGLEERDLIFVGDAFYPGGNDRSVMDAGIKSVQVSGPRETAEIIKGWFS